MIRLQRHDDSISHEEDGAVRVEDLASIFPSRNESTRTGQEGEVQRKRSSTA